MGSPLLPMSAEDFVWGFERSGRYTLIEIAMFEGRSAEAKTALLRGLFSHLRDDVGLVPNDVETITGDASRELGHPRSAGR